MARTLHVDPFDEDLVWWRSVRVGIDVDERTDPASEGRWQRLLVVDALYLSSNAETVMAEWHNFLEQYGRPKVGAGVAERDLYSMTVDFSEEIADLSTEEKLDAVRLEVPVPGRATWPAYQAVGEQLFRDGWGGLVAPSAPYPGGLTLCLFIDPRTPFGLARLSGPDRQRVLPPRPPGMRPPP